MSNILLHVEDSTSQYVISYTSARFMYDIKLCVIESKKAAFHLLY